MVLLGGVAKRAPNGSLGFWRLAEPLTCHRAVVAFGRDGPEIAEELLSVGVTSTVAQSLKEAVVEASQLALPGKCMPMPIVPVLLAIMVQVYVEDGIDPS